MKQPYVLGIDIGTGSTKAVAVDFKGTPLVSAQAYYSTVSPQPGYSEQNPLEIWQAFIFCIKDIMIKMEDKPAAVCLGSAMHSLLPVDSEGKPLYNMITWADTRSATVAEALQNHAEAENIYKATGTPLHAMTPLSKLMYFKEHDPQFLSKTEKFISIKEFIWYQLFNEYEVDHSIASATGLFNIQTFDWHQPALDMAGVHKHQLSTPVSTLHKRWNLQPSVATLLGIEASTPFIIGASDGCLANLGTLCIKPGVAAATIATSGAVRIASPVPVHNFKAMLFNYVLDDDTFICGGPINNGGVTVKWFIESFLKKSNDNDFEKLFNSIETVPPGSKGLIFLPYLLGERAPIWDSKSCGSFFGIRIQHTETYFLRAVVEGVCYALYDVLKMLEKDCVVDEIRVSGGFTKSDKWMQLLATITGKKVYLLQTEDASATGAAFMALMSIGVINDYEELQTNKYIQCFTPDENIHQVYKQYFTVYEQLYPNLKATMHMLHSITNSME